MQIFIETTSRDLFINFYIGLHIQFILMYTCGLTVVIKRICCYVIFLILDYVYNISQLNLPHETKQKGGKERKKVKTDMPRSIGKQSGGIFEVSPKEENEGYGGNDLQKR